MTKDELDALRARVTASLHFGGCCVLTVWPDITALLAESRDAPTAVVEADGTRLYVEAVAALKATRDGR